MAPSRLPLLLALAALALPSAAFAEQGDLCARGYCDDNGNPTMAKPEQKDQARLPREGDPDFVGPVRPATPPQTADRSGATPRSGLTPTPQPRPAPNRNASAGPPELSGADDPYGFATLEADKAASKLLAANTANGRTGGPRPAVVPRAVANARGNGGTQDPLNGAAAGDENERTETTGEGPDKVTVAKAPKGATETLEVNQVTGLIESSIDHATWDSLRNAGGRVITDLGGFKVRAAAVTSPAGSDPYSLDDTCSGAFDGCKARPAGTYQGTGVIRANPEFVRPVTNTDSTIGI